MTLKLEKLGQVTIVDSKGKPSSFFQTLWQRTVTAIQTSVNDLSSIVAQIQAQQAQINQAIQDIQIAQQTANNNASGTSGSDTDPNITVSSLVTWTPGPSVSLTGVAANNLTIPGSGPQQDSDVTVFISNVTQIVMQGEYRLVEVIGGVDGAMFGPWNFQVSYPEPPVSAGTYPGTVLNTDSAVVAAFTQALVTTGTIEYRLDFRRISGPTVQNLRGYLFARRS